MADDRSPGLGGRHLTDGEINGREPVISGIHSELLLDRGRVYLAGNLGGLLSLMTDDQRLAFKQWRVKVAVRRASRLLAAYEEAHPHDYRPRQAIEAAEAWLENPCMQTTHNASIAWEQCVAALVAGLVGDPVRPSMLAAALAASVACSRPGAFVPRGLHRRAALRAAYIILQDHV